MAGEFWRVVTWRAGYRQMQHGRERGCAAGCVGERVGRALAVQRDVDAVLGAAAVRRFQPIIVLVMEASSGGLSRNHWHYHWPPERPSAQPLVWVRTMNGAGICRCGRWSCLLSPELSRFRSGAPENMASLSSISLTPNYKKSSRRQNTCRSAA